MADDNRDADRQMEQAVWPDMSEKMVKKQIGRLVECLERVTLALQGIDVSLEHIAKHSKKAEKLLSIDGSEE